MTGKGGCRLTVTVVAPTLEQILIIIFVNCSEYDKSFGCIQLFIAGKCFRLYSIVFFFCLQQEMQFIKVYSNCQ